MKPRVGAGSSPSAVDEDRRPLSMTTDSNIQPRRTDETWTDVSRPWRHRDRSLRARQLAFDGAEWRGGALSARRPETWSTRRPLAAFREFLRRGDLRCPDHERVRYGEFHGQRV